MNSERKNYQKLSGKDQKDDAMIKLKKETREPEFTCNKCDQKLENFDKLKHTYSFCHNPHSSFQNVQWGRGGP